MASPKLDLNGDTVKVRSDGVVCVDGSPIGRKVMRGGHICLQVCDRSKLRSQGRGTRLIEIPLEVLVEKLSEPRELT